MKLKLFVLWSLITNSYALPVRLGQMDFDNAESYGGEWRCFAVFQIKKIECEEWKDQEGSRVEEHSDIEFVIETDDEIFEYGFNNTFAVCSEDRHDILNLLKGQKYFCILGRSLGQASEVDLIYSKKPINSWIYECLRSPSGQVGKHGGFGYCWDN